MVVVGGWWQGGGMGVWHYDVKGIVAIEERFDELAWYVRAGRILDGLCLIQAIPAREREKCFKIVKNSNGTPP